MTAVDILMDTNILIDAHDVDAGDRHTKAARLVRGFWDRREVPAVSVQALQEMHVNMVRKGVPQGDSADTVRSDLACHVIENTRLLLRQALALHQRWQLSYWDAAVVAAAQQAGARELWTEDLTAGQDFGGVVVVNPLV